MINPRKTRNAGRMRKVGYQSRDAGTHRIYNYKASIKRYEKTGKMLYKDGGSGHRAGEKWGDDKEIDPESTNTKYSKNSPSFDEGVYLSKKRRMAEKMINNK